MNRIKIAFFVALLLLPIGAKAAVADSTKTYNQVVPVVTRVAGSFAINAGLTEVLKSSIDATRPDGERNDSWPSRHTSYAFTGASILSHELYKHSAWWVAGSHVAADAVAMQRLIVGEHFPKDVLGGAMVGLVSTEIGYFLTDLIFPGSRVPLPDVLSDWLPSLDVTTTAAFPLCGGARGVDGRVAMFTAIRGSVPFSEHWGATAAVNFRSMPLYEGDAFSSMISSAGLSFGVAGFAWLPSKRWSAEWRFMQGISRNFDCEGVSHPGWSFTFDATAAATCRFTEDLAVGIEGGYTFWTLRRDVSALSLGLFTRVIL